MLCSVFARKLLNVNMSHCFRHFHFHMLCTSLRIMVLFSIFLHHMYNFTYSTYSIIQLLQENVAVQLKCYQILFSLLQFLILQFQHVQSHRKKIYFSSYSKKWNESTFVIILQGATPL